MYEAHLRKSGEALAQALRALSNQILVELPNIPPYFYQVTTVPPITRKLGFTIWSVSSSTVSRVRPWREFTRFTHIPWPWLSSNAMEPHPGIGELNPSPPHLSVDYLVS